MVVLPTPTAVASPEASTVATPSSADDHATTAPATADPFASRTVAVSRAVSPRAVNANEPGDTSTLAAS